MKILFVNEKCGYFGGVEQNVAATVKGLREQGHECSLAYGENARDYDAYKSLFGNVYPCSEILVQPASGFDLSFEQIAKTVSPDVIYVHKTPRTDFLLPLVNRIRIVRMVHDHDLCCPRKHKYFFHNTRTCHYKAGWRCYLDLAFLEKGGDFLNRFKFVSITEKLREMRNNYNWDSLLVGSRFMEQELIMNGFPQEKVHIVSPSVPLKPVLVTDPSIEPSILCVSQLIRGKGVDLLLQALSRLSCEFKATIVGTGNSEAELKDLCGRLGLNDRVKFTGWVRNEVIGRYYADSRVIVAPSRWPEPFGMIGLEAMRHARPVVAFDVGGIPDWLENEITGFLVPEQDIEAFSHAIETILLDQQLAIKFGLAGLEKAQDKFSFDKFLTRIAKYLEQN